MPTPVLLLHSTKETMDFVRWFHECAREREIQERDWFRLVFARWPGSSTLAYGGQVCNYLLVAIRGACKKAKKFQSYLLACSRVASLRFCFTIKFGALAMPVLPAGGAAVLLDE